MTQTRKDDGSTVIQLLAIKTKMIPMVDKPDWRTLAIPAFLLLLVLLFFGASAWYGSRQDTRPVVMAPQVQADLALKAGTQADKAEAALASPFAFTAKAPLRSSYTGRWMGTLDIGGTKGVQFSLNLLEADGQISGSATFPIGEGVIESGKIVADQLSFVTRHHSPSNGQVLLTQFSGTLADGGLKLTMLSEGGKSYLTLNPVSR